MVRAIKEQLQPVLRRAGLRQTNPIKDKPKGGALGGGSEIPPGAAEAGPINPSFKGFNPEQLRKINKERGVGISGPGVFPATHPFKLDPRKGSPFLPGVQVPKSVQNPQDPTKVKNAPPPNLNKLGLT